jgi:hypothetical protein
MAVVVAGCGSGDTPEAGETSPTSNSTTSPAPSIAKGTPQPEGVIEKKIGQPAGLSCIDDPDEPCELNFNVTAIQPGVSCAAATDRPEPDEQLLRFDVDAFSTKDTYEFPDTADALLLSNWSIDGPGGTVGDLVAYPECGSGLAPISAPVTPGPHARARVVVRAPKPATKLRLSWLTLMWEWPIPGAD